MWQWHSRHAPLIMRPGHLAKGVSFWPSGWHTFSVTRGPGVHTGPSPLLLAILMPKWGRFRRYKKAKINNLWFKQQTGCSKLTSVDFSWRQQHDSSLPQRTKWGKKGGGGVGFPPFCSKEKWVSRTLFASIKVQLTDFSIYNSPLSFGEYNGHFILC